MFASANSFPRFYLSKSTAPRFDSVHESSGGRCFNFVIYGRPIIFYVVVDMEKGGEPTLKNQRRKISADRRNVIFLAEIRCQRNRSDARVNRRGGARSLSGCESLTRRVRLDESMEIKLIIFLARSCECKLDEKLAQNLVEFVYEVISSDRNLFTRRHLRPENLQQLFSVVILMERCFRQYYVIWIYRVTGNSVWIIPV